MSNDSKTNDKVYPIEVKSSKNYTTTSYTLFKERFGKRIAGSYIVHPSQFSYNETSYKIPI